MDWNALIGGLGALANLYGAQQNVKAVQGAAGNYMPWWQAAQMMSPQQILSAYNSFFPQKNVGGNTTDPRYLIMPLVYRWLQGQSPSIDIATGQGVAGAARQGQKSLESLKATGINPNSEAFRARSGAIGLNTGNQAQGFRNQGAMAKESLQGQMGFPALMQLLGFGGQTQQAAMEGGRGSQAPPIASVGSPWQAIGNWAAMYGLQKQQKPT